MRLCKGIGLTLVIMCVIGTAATSAWAAEPTFKLLPGEEAEETGLEAHVEKNITFETTAGNKIICALHHLFTAWIFFIIQIANAENNDKCEDGKKVECNSAGEKAGVIKYTTEKGKPVFTSLSPLTVGFLSTVPETEITCGKLKIKLRGTMLEAYKGPLGSDVTSFKDAINGSKGKPELTRYFGGKEGKEELHTKLEMNFGLGFVEAALNIGEFEDKVEKMVIVEG